MRMAVERTAERFEEVFLVLCRHAHAVVLALELKLGIVIRPCGTFLQGDADAASVGGVLDGIAQQVQEDLLQTERVSDDLLVVQLFYLYLQCMLVFLHGT